MSNLNTKPAELVKRPHLTDEVVEKRTENSKTYRVAENRYTLVQTIAPIHYKPSEQANWEEIDLTFDENFEIHNAPYDLKIYTDRVGYEYTSKKGGTVTVELVGVNGAVPKGEFTVRNEDNFIIWEGVDTDLDMKLEVRPKRAEIFKVLKSARAPKRFRWRFTEDEGGHPTVNKKILGKDADGESIEMQTQEHEISRIKGKHTFELEEEFTGRVSRRVDEKTRRKEWFDNPKYPVLVDASVEEDVAIGDDDVDEDLPYGYLDYDGNGLEIDLTNAPYGTAVGLRFQSLGVPQGATVTAALLHGVAAGFTVVESLVRVYADDVDDAPGWSGNGDVTGITKTSASVLVDWDVDAGFPVQGDITSVVQEVVNRAGWSTGNSIRLGCFANEDAHAGEIDSYEAGSPASLEITYESEGGGEEPTRRILGPGITRDPS